jgi:hypothetical protein
MYFKTSLGWPGDGVRRDDLGADPFAGAMPEWMKQIPPEQRDAAMTALVQKSRPATPGIWDRIVQGAQQAGTQLGKAIGSGTQYPPAPGPAMMLPGAASYQEPRSMMPYLLIGGAALGAFLLLRKKG